MSPTDRRRELLAAAALEARRLGHRTAGPLHLARALGRQAPEALAVHLGAGAQRRLALALQRRGSGDAAQLEAFVAPHAAGSTDELLAALAPLVRPLLAPPAPDAPPDAPLERGNRDASQWSIGDEILGTYEVLAVAGEGGMGLVYRVRHRGWNVDMAVKCPRPRALATESGRDAFEREAQLWAELGLHPHICACHYVRRLGGVPRVFAEYADGGTVADQIRKRTLYGGGPASALQTILKYSIQAARGLGYAHAHGVVHQDVKPANLLLFEQITPMYDPAYHGHARDFELKVSDFGIARAAATPAGATSAGDPRVSVGGATPAYRSPEQAGAGRERDAAPRLSPATDVWSLAVSILELFMGDLPGPEGAAAGLVLALFRKRGPPDPRIPPLPGDLADVLERCLRDDPRERPSMGELVVAVEQVFAERTGSSYSGPSEQVLELSGELSNRALSMLDLRREQDAERLFDEALRQDPHHFEATYNQGLRLWRSARITDDELLRRLAVVRASSGAAADTDVLLAQVHLERGDVGSATRLLEPGHERADVPQRAAALALAATARERVSRSEVRAADAAVRVAAVALAPDGRQALIAVGAALELLDLASGELVRRLAVGEDLWSAAWHAQGRTAVSGHTDGAVRVWDLESGRGATMPAGHTDSVEGVALAGDGSTALTGARDGTARLWGLANRECLHVFSAATQQVSSVAMTPDGALGVSASFDGTVQVLDLREGRTDRVVQAHRDWVWAVALTPDGRLAMTASQDATAGLWDVRSGRRLASLTGGHRPVLSAALSRDGGLALTGDDSGALRLWELPGGRCLRTIDAGSARVQVVSLAPDGRRALTGGPDGRVRLWILRRDLDQRAPFAYTRPRGGSSAGRHAIVLRNALAEVDRLLDAGEAGNAGLVLELLRRQQGVERLPAVVERRRRAGGHGRRAGLRAAWPLHVIAAHDAGPAPIGGGFSNLPAGVTLVGHTVPGRNARIRAVALTPDGRRALSASNDHNARIWDAARATCPYTLRHDEWATAGALATDGRRAVTASHDGSVFVWDCDGPGLVKVLRCHDNAVASVALTAGGELALTGSFDGTARLWDLRSATCTRTFEAQRDPVDLTPDGLLALTAGRDHAVRLWDLRSGSCVRMLAHGDHVAAAALAADGRIAVTGCKAVVRVWDLGDGSCRHELEQSGYVQSLALSADGRVALSGALDRSLWIWDLESGTCLHKLEGHTAVVGAVALSADGHVALSGSDDGTLRVWQLDWDYDFARPPDEPAARSPARNMGLVRLIQGNNYWLASRQVGVMNIYEDGDRPGSVRVDLAVFDRASSTDEDLVVRRGDELTIGTQRYRVVDAATAQAGERAWVELEPVP